MTDTQQQIAVRNAFLAGAVSASLLWGLASWTMQKKKKSCLPSRRNKTISTSNSKARTLTLNDSNNHDLVDHDGRINGNDQQQEHQQQRRQQENSSSSSDDDYGFMVGEEHHNLQTNSSTPTHAQHHGIDAPSSSSPSFPKFYNPWSTEPQSQQQSSIETSEPLPLQQEQYQLHKQLLELRTSLIEHSRRTSLLLLDKILSQATKHVNVGEIKFPPSTTDASAPKKRVRMRWPWESLRRKLTDKDEEQNSLNNGSVSSDGGEITPGSPVRRRGGFQLDGSGNGIVNGESSSPPSPSSDGNESKEETKDICIGSIFGLDVGGTLSKLVYFEKKRDNGVGGLVVGGGGDVRGISSRMGGGSSSTSDIRARTYRNSFYDQTRRTSTSAATLEHEYVFDGFDDDDDAPPFALRQSTTSEESSSFEDISYSEHDLKSTHYPIHTTDVSPSNLNLAEDVNEFKRMKRSHSLFDLSSKKAKREEALNRFYEFANNLDTYDTEVKDKALSLYSRALGGEVHFIQFETRYLPQAMDLIRINDLHLNISKMGATGGGAHKYSDKWEQMLGIEIVKQDELDSLVAGMQFIMSDVVGECYTYLKNGTDSKDQHGARQDEMKNSDDEEIPKKSSDPEHSEKGSAEDENKPHENPQTESKDDKPNKSWTRKVKRDLVAKSDSYPYLLVMIGTGVSVIRVDGPRKHERISGSTIGGGTYWGLCRLLTDVEDFESVLDLAEKGDPSKVDMMVGDIYGKDSNALDKLGLTSDIVASSFGKLVAQQDPAAGLKQEDLARALLLMVTNNIGQVAYLNAQLHNTKNIYFVGNFLRHNSISQQRLSYAINYWSRGQKEALFLEHEGYFGALGAFLLHQGISADKDGKVAQSKVESRRSRQENKFRKKRSVSF